uniref:Uncharacterized protein n=1 Tax=Mustela putorius furo TaxID=9669 RepID=M3YTW3_MUSPF
SFLSDLTACSGVQPHPLCLPRPAGRRGRRRLRRHPPVPPRPALPLTSDPVSADPQLDINSRNPESQPGAPSGPRAGAQSPAQLVRGTNSQSWGSEGAQEAVAKTPAAASRRARDADSSPADALHPQKPRICANRRNCINGSLLEINKALSTVRLKDEKDSTPGLHALTSYKRRRHAYKSSQYGDKCSCIHRGGLQDKWTPIVTEARMHLAQDSEAAGDPVGSGDAVDPASAYPTKVSQGV